MFRVSGSRRVDSECAGGGPGHRGPVERHGGEQPRLEHQGLEAEGEAAQTKGGQAFTRDWGVCRDVCRAAAGCGEQ